MKQPKYKRGGYKKKELTKEVFSVRVFPHEKPMIKDYLNVLRKEVVLDDKNDLTTFDKLKP